MKLSERSKLLLDRYLLAVERHLPIQGRKDMIAEIRSNLMDTLEDQYPMDESVDETKLEEQLRKLGSPRSVAAPYFPSDALIAPQYNTIFRLIVTRLTPIVVGAVVFAGLLSFVLSKGASPFWSLWELVGTGWQVGVGLIGTAAVVLMILSRFFPQLKPGKDLEFVDDENRNWKVSELPEVISNQDKVQPWEVILGIVFGVLALLFWLFFFDELAGIWWLVEEKWRMVPIFTNAFKAFIPWIAVNTSLGLLANLIMAIKGKRGLLSRLIEIGIKVSEISLISVMLKAGPLVSLDKEIAVTQGIPQEGILGIQTLLQNNFVHWFLIFLVVVLCIDLLKNIVLLIKRAVTQ